MTVELLTRETALPKLTTPNGRVFTIEPWEENPALYRIAYGDETPGKIPDKLSGLYTKVSLAQADLEVFLNSMWDMSEAASKKR